MESDELTLAYLSIDSMKNQILSLESENKELKRLLGLQHDSVESTWSPDDEYHRGFNGSGY
jgi:hypothetical protein